MYADDFNDIMTPNAGLGEPVVNGAYYAWVNPAFMGWCSQNANTNVDLLKTTLLAPYLSYGVNVYKRAADRIPSANGQRVRSYSMNSQMGCATSPQGYTPPNYNPGFRPFGKKSELGGVFSPVQAFVFVDEHAGSINDGYFQAGMSTYGYPDVPGSRHAGACGFSFADGQVMVLFRVTFIRQPVGCLMKQNTPSHAPGSPPKFLHSDVFSACAPHVRM
jgi:prepilin-type processing-associated H-X9-DG protein